MVALVVTTITLLLVLVSSRHSVLSATTVIVSTVAAATFVFLEQRRPRVGIRPVVAAIGLVLLVAVSLPPRSSNDVWSYTMYGRMVSVHGASPYEHVPADFRSDPFQKRVSPIWQHRGSVYGPAFVGYATAVTFLAGDSVTVDRLLFQLGALLVVAAVLWLVWRRTRSPSALAWLGLHPLFGAVIVNNGQIDAFVGLAILAAVLLAAERRGVAAGFAIAAASLVKITGLVALAGIVFWLWRRGERKVAARATVAAGAVVGLVYLPFVTGASHVLNGADHTVTPGSPWNLPAQLFVGKDAGRDLPGLIVHNSTLSTIFYLSLALTAVLAVLLAWRWARSPRPDLATGAATASYAIAAEYTLPWYAAWAMPVFADRRPSPLGWIVWAQAAVLLAAWRLPTHHTGGVFDTVLRGTFAYALPIVLLVAFAAVRNRGTGDAPAPGPVTVGAAGGP
jgi:alpha-1,6-mannosyltransferase